MCKNIIKVDYQLVLKKSIEELEMKNFSSPQYVSSKLKWTKVFIFIDHGTFILYMHIRPRDKYNDFATIEGNFVSLEYLVCMTREFSRIAAHCVFFFLDLTDT